MADLSIAIEILGQDHFSGAAGAAKAGLGGLLGGVKELGLGVLGVSAVFDAGKGAIESLIGPAIDAEKVASQTAAVLKSTGEAAGLSIDDISGLASSLSKLTPFEDEAIQSSSNLLLTFTNVGGEVFPQAQEAILNMSQALGQDLQSSTVQLGKALNDPIKGITALSRVGVSFTADQKEMIKTMVEAGDTAGAQGVILGELDKEFGGAAKAAGQTFAGQLVILQTAVGNVAEAIGGPLVKGLSSLATGILPVVQAFADELPGAIDGFMSTAEPVVSFLESAFTGALSGVVTFVGELLGLATGDYASAWEIMGDLPAAFMNTFFPVIQAITDGWNTVIQVFQGDWSASDSINPVVNIIGQLATIVRDDVLPILLLLGDTVTAVMTGDFTTAFNAMKDVLFTALPFLVNDLALMGKAFVDWIAPLIPPMLQQLLNVLIQIDTWIVSTGLPMLVTQLAVWAGAFVDWILPLIPPVLRELGGLLVQMSSWMLTVAAPAMIQNLIKWGLAFVEWVAPRIPPLLVELGKLELELIGWVVGTALPAIVGKLVEWGGAFLGWVAKDVLPTLPQKLVLILNAVSDWAVGALNSMATEAGKLGAGFVKGIQDGIGGALDGLKRWVTDNLANALPQWVRDVLGIHSPSSVFADIGANMIKGLEQGILSSWPSVETVIQRLMSQFAGLSANVSGDAADWLRAALAITGTSGDWFGDLYELMKMESGGDPGAQNPEHVIVNGVDLGQAAGLMQMLPGTFRAHMLEGFGNIWNPIDNAVSAIRYIKDTYGSVHNIDRSPAGGYLGYADGGVVPGPPGMGQWAYVHGGETIIPPGKSGGTTINVQVPAVVGITAQQLVDYIQTELIRKGLNNVTAGIA